jgi:hypothetical protein
MKTRLNILIGLGGFFIFAIFLALILNNSLGFIIMGIAMFSFLFFALGITFYDVISPRKVVEAMSQKIDEKGIKSAEGMLNAIALPMMAIGLLFVFVSVFVWFKYYI